MILVEVSLPDTVGRDPKKENTAVYVLHVSLNGRDLVSM